MNLVVAALTLAALGAMIGGVLAQRFGRPPSAARRPVDMLLAGCAAMAIVGTGLLAHDCITNERCLAPPPADAEPRSLPPVPGR